MPSFMSFFEIMQPPAYKFFTFFVWSKRVKNTKKIGAHRSRAGTLMGSRLASLQKDNKEKNTFGTKKDHLGRRDWSEY